MTQTAVEFSLSVEAVEQAAEAARAAMNDGRHLEAFYRWLDIQHHSPGHPEAYYSAGQALRALRSYGDTKMELESNIYGGIPLKGDGTIAIVGNSPNVKGRSYGAEIDQHDTVLRINRAWNKINEADLGAKTTVLFLGHFPKKYMTITRKSPTRRLYSLVDEQLGKYFPTWNRLGEDFFRKKLPTILHEGCL